MNKIKSQYYKMSGEEDPNKTVVDDINELFPSLTFKQRLIAFVGCVVFGFLLNIVAFIMLAKKSAIGFAVLYSLGNLITIAASLFLRGPMAQLKKMFDKVRIVATIIFFLALITTVVVAIVTQNIGAVILCCIIQYIAFIWYSISYIPFAHKAIKKAVGFE
eukprot:TRINITY_DN14201_c0_g1_i1.p2 TRINITY_DN14201_c0_g1~~TRINITY_DN14201_c0_g1_i1.p2  ORF type:complete len:161 (-),score=37.73 TRINITY_DN14201_c0_g1_i1:58-540(-)